MLSLVLVLPAPILLLALGTKLTLPGKGTTLLMPEVARGLPAPPLLLLTSSLLLLGVPLLGSSLAAAPQYSCMALSKLGPAMPSASMATSSSVGATSNTRRSQQREVDTSSSPCHRCNLEGCKHK